MNVRWLSWINFTLIIAALIFFVAGTYYFFSFQPEEVVCSGAKADRCGLPKNSFEFPEETYENLGETVLTLQHSPPTMQLPDLKGVLLYYGKNGRPDADQEHPLFHFALSCNNKEIHSAKFGEPLYLIFDRSGTPCKYIFSPKNEKTHLWITAEKLEGNDIFVEVNLENDAGERITEPQAFAKIKLPEKDFSKVSGAGFEIGGQRVDGSLFSRQKAKWFGVDRFLEQHGGDEYKNIVGKQRVDFGEGEDQYSVFMTLGDALIWNGKRWQEVSSGVDSLDKPLLVVKKLEERLLSCELWDKEGKSKTVLNLLKSTEPPSNQVMQSLQTAFKFLGARTFKQCVFEINGERVILTPSDWLLQTPKGWKKLATEEEIDNYVQRKLTGALFVFTGMIRKDEKQVMKGLLYSPSRNDVQSIEITLQAGGSGKAVSKEIKDEDEDEDEVLDARRKQPPINRGRENLPQPIGNTQNRKE